MIAGSAGPGGHLPLKTIDQARTLRMKRSTMGTVRWTLGIGCVLTVAAGAAAVLWNGAVTVTSAQTPAAEAPLVTVAAPLVREVTDFDEFTGRFEPTATVEIRPRVSGYLTEINFTDGDVVEADQTLFVIDKRPYQAALAQAEAQLAGAKAQLTFAAADAERSEQLVKTSNISVAVHEQRVQQMQAADAAMKAADAAVQRARLELDFTEVRSPIRGKVSNRRVDLGNLVIGDGASTILTNVVAQDELYFVFYISEGDLLERRRSRGAPEQEADDVPVQARQDGETGWTQSGKLDFIDNRLQAGSGTIQARATFPNPRNRLTPGQFGRIRLPRGEAYEAVLIPEAAVANDQYNKVALIVDGENIVRQRPVVLGPTQPGGLIVVREGLAAGDRVLINGFMQARPGQPVRTQPGSIEPAAAQS